MKRTLEIGKFESDRIAEEAAVEVFLCMPWGKTISVNGQEAKIERVSKRPKLNEDGVVSFIFDVRFKDHHIEFCVEKSGWGRSCVHQ